MAARRFVPVLATVLMVATAVAGQERTVMGREATAVGTFDVVLVPVSPPDPTIGSMTLTKTFHGDLAATSRGQMLSAGSPASGAAGYVAIEQVSGTLAGRHGAFALQHSGTIAAGMSTLAVAVVPGSASGELAGLSGTMTIDGAGGQHRYTFRYTLPN